VPISDLVVARTKSEMKFKKMKDANQGSTNRKECEHEWRPLGSTPGHTHVKLVCVKCGEEKLIELFP